MKSLNEIVELLNQSIPPEAIHQGDSSKGIFGDYVTAQWAMQEPNALLGVDGIVDVEFESDKAIEIPLPGKTFGHWTFILTIKLWFEVEKDGEPFRFPRPGRGVGQAMCPYNRERSDYEPVTPRQVDTAAKTALSAEAGMATSSLRLSSSRIAAVINASSSARLRHESQVSRCFFTADARSAPSTPSA